MKCLNCGGQATDDAAECPSCGVLFAKWKELQSRKERKAAAALAAAAAPPSSALNLWAGRGIAAALVGAWMLGLGLYYRHRQAGVHPRKRIADEKFVEVRDPATGEMRRLPIIDPRR